MANHQAIEDCVKQEALAPWNRTSNAWQQKDITIAVPLNMPRVCTVQLQAT
jgi:hypothetical protein